jgi:hypothetical protein
VSIERLTRTDAPISFRRAAPNASSLREVRDLLSISAQRDVARIKRTAQTKLADIDQRVLALQRIRNGLATLIAACPGHGRAADCPILNALSGEKLE